MNLEFHIEELRLEGFSFHDRYLIGAAIERELVRLYAERGAAPSLLRDREVAQLNAGAFEVAPDAKPEMIGAQVAQAVYGGVQSWAP